MPEVTMIHCMTKMKSVPGLVWILTMKNLHKQHRRDYIKILFLQAQGCRFSKVSKPELLILQIYLPILGQ